MAAAMRAAAQVAEQFSAARSKLPPVPKPVTQAAHNVASSVASAATGGVRASREAVGIQLQAFWQSYGTYVSLAGAGFGVYVLWRSMYGAAGFFVDVSETFAELGLLGLAVSVGTLGMLYVRSLYTIDPDAAYRLAMRALNAHAGALELLGAPVVGSEARAFVQTGGHLRLSKKWRPKFASRRCHLIFPVKGLGGSRGIASLEAKKRVRFPWRSTMEIKLLAVDVPNAPGGSLGRIYIVGDDDAYDKGSRGKGLMAELRDPLLQAMARQGDDEAEDDQDDEDEGEATRAGDRT
eukprot:PRCOL_00001688-RA